MQLRLVVSYDISIGPIGPIVKRQAVKEKSPPDYSLYCATCQNKEDLINNEEEACNQPLPIRMSFFRPGIYVAT